VGTHAYVGGFTVVTKDVLPYSKTVGNRARVYGINTVGLLRRGFSREQMAAVREAYRSLLLRRLNVSQALERLEAGSPTPEVRTLIDFVRSSTRGVIFKRRRRPSPEA
jgi:UDP-N-acetylglucosamine acyltransferase